MEGARRFLHGLFAVEAVVAGVAFVCIAVALFSDVLAREAFGNGIFGAQRFAVHCMAISALLGFALAVAYGAHMRVTLADRLFPRRLDRAVNRVSDLIACGICVFLGVWAVKFVYVSYLAGDRGMALNVLLWPIQSAIAWMFASAAIRYCLYAVFPPLRPAEPEHG